MPKRNKHINKPDIYLCIKFIKVQIRIKNWNDINKLFDVLKLEVCLSSGYLNFVLYTQARIIFIYYTVISCTNNSDAVHFLESLEIYFSLKSWRNILFIFIYLRNL